MKKLPPIEKISEAYTAIEDNRINLLEDYAIVKSSNFEKEYLVKWKENNITQMIIQVIGKDIPDIQLLQY